MQRTFTSSESRSNDFPDFPILPVLEFYGFTDVRDDHGWHDVRCEFHGDHDKSGSARTEHDGDGGAYNCHAFQSCPKGNAVQVIMIKEGVSFSDAVHKAEEITGQGSARVRGQLHGSGRPVSREPRDQQSYSAFKKLWRGDGSDS